MQNSRQSISKQINELGPSAKTPGTLGILDSGGDTPGTLGVFDHGDITICKRSEGTLKILKVDRVSKLVTIEFNKIASVLEIWLYLFEPKASVRRRWKKFYGSPNAPRTTADYWINLKQRRKSAYEDLDEIFDAMQRRKSVISNNHSYIEFPEKLYKSKVLARIRPDLLKKHPDLKFKIPQTELDLMRISANIPKEDKKKLEKLQVPFPRIYANNKEHIRAIERHISSRQPSSSVLLPDIREWFADPHRNDWFTNKEWFSLHLKNVLINLPAGTVLGSMTFIYSTGPTTISTVMWKKNYFPKAEGPALMRTPWKSFRDVLCNLLFDLNVWPSDAKRQGQTEFQKKFLMLIEHQKGKKSKK